MSKTDKKEEVSRKVIEDVFEFGEKVNKIMFETTKGYAKQVFKVALLDIMVNTLVQQFRDRNLGLYERTKDLILDILEESGSKVIFSKKEEEEAGK